MSTTPDRLLRSEHDALRGAVDRLLGETGRLPVSDVVGAYYLAISLGAAVEAARRAGIAAHESRDLLDRFNRILHPRVARELSDAIQEQITRLQTQSHEETRKETECEAGAYSRLREMMSTREFVRQYGQGMDI